MSCKEMRSLLMDFLYEEISAADRELFLGHLATCKSCQQDYIDLRRTSRMLQEWEDVNPDFNFIVVNEKSHWANYLKDLLAKLIPRPRKLVYGVIGSLVGIFLLLAAANTEISYQSKEFKLRLGLFQKPTSATSSADYLATQRLIEQLQQENYLLMTSLIQQSEARQRKEMASAFIQLRQDIERQRIEDLNLVGLGLDNIERNTYHRIQKTDNSLNEFIRLINAQPK